MPSFRDFWRCAAPRGTGEGLTPALPALRCYPPVEVEGRRELYLESLLERNGGSGQDCAVVRAYWARQQYDEDYPYEEEEQADQEQQQELCSEQELVEVQTEFQECSHNITLLVAEEEEEASVCLGLRSLRTSCAPLLSPCLRSDQVDTMLQAQIDQVCWMHYLFCKFLLSR